MVAKYPSNWTTFQQKQSVTGYLAAGALAKVEVHLLDGAKCAIVTWWWRISPDQFIIIYYNKKWALKTEQVQGHVLSLLKTVYIYSYPFVDVLLPLCGSLLTCGLVGLGAGPCVWPVVAYLYLAAIVINFTFTKSVALKWTNICLCMVSRLFIILDISEYPCYLLVCLSLCLSWFFRLSMFAYLL